ncbi:hypothetical protein OG288_15800 [Streptomyces tauricus]|uniref:Uncharacterized protein n=1 Tax=Streptomyces tauricus TaxID=68274 RepID=A0ABZ1JGG0_9ACTN|nr:hypothetical protein [Streptomyces tauricus]
MYNKTELLDYIESPIRTAARENLWDRVQFDNFDPDELASVPLEDLMFLCTRAEAHRYADQWSRMQNNAEIEGTTNAE